MSTQKAKAYALGVKRGQANADQWWTEYQPASRRLAAKRITRDGVRVVVGYLPEWNAHDDLREWFVVTEDGLMPASETDLVSEYEMGYYIGRNGRVEDLAKAYIVRVER